MFVQILDHCGGVRGDGTYVPINTRVEIDPDGDVWGAQNLRLRCEPQGFDVLMECIRTVPSSDAGRFDWRRE